MADSPEGQRSEGRKIFQEENPEGGRIGHCYVPKDMSVGYTSLAEQRALDRTRGKKESLCLWKKEQAAHKVVVRLCREKIIRRTYAQVELNLTLP